jgi:hypothetical protein
MMKHGHFMGNIGSLRGNIGGASRWIDVTLASRPRCP